MSEDKAAAALETRVRTQQVVSLATLSYEYVVMVPLWALGISYVMSGPFPLLGVTPWSISVWWCIGCLASSILTLSVSRGFWNAINRQTNPNIEQWAALLLFARSSVALAWGSSFWVFWQPENDANLLFLIVLIIAACVNNTVERSGMYMNFIGTVWMLTGIAFLMMVATATPLAVLFMVIIPSWTAWLSWDMWKVCAQVRNSIRHQFQNEELADALINARDEAERNRRYAEHANASKTAFLANMSHELRTPLNAILGFSEIISTEALGSGAQVKYRDYAGDIHSSGKHLLSLINDLLDIAKIEAGKLEVSPQWINSAQIVRECLHMMETRANDKRIRMTWSVTADTTRVFADERALRQILFNLITNALKFTPEKGNVEVRISRSGDEAIVTVEDTGCGIPKHQVDRIFLPFEQIDNSYASTVGGTGLGLTLVKALTELHGGRCTLDSEEGFGTKVRAHFPVPKSLALVERGTDAKNAITSAAPPRAAGA